MRASMIVAGGFLLVAGRLPAIAAAEPAAKPVVAASEHPADAKPVASPEAVRFFEAKVRPVLVDNCYKCHGDTKQEDNLRLDSRAALLAGGDQGPAMVPGKPQESLLIQAVKHSADLSMPPKKKLSGEEIDDLSRWVESGGYWPEEDKTAAAPPRKPMQITAKDRAHWAFQSVRQPPIPSANRLGKYAAWSANPIDAFILARLEAKNLEPNPPASKRQLIRRLYYDLTGLPPTPAEAEAFAADKSPGAYDTLVDRLLASPQYGEKWGRHWLDLVRYAETNSYERDNPKPNVWRYRDYVIRSFNEDKPYDQFVREQLAGDEFLPPTADGVIATGYYRLGIWDDEPSDRELARYDGLDDIVATTGQVFLGLTVDCARCHDHKIDPIPQRDYYKLLSFFQNVHPYHNGGPTDEQPIPPSPGEPAGRSPGMALCVTERGREAPDTFVLLRGNPNNHGDKVEPGFLEVLGNEKAVVPTPAPNAKTTGRRTALANWIVAPTNPLTARVMVNRIWQYHFGRGIVRSPNNFGTQGDAPTHPELLDWLAAEFVRQGWRLKPLHRLIVRSNAYRMSSAGNAAALAADPANDLFWRFDMRRLTAEEVRDSILAVSGKLNRKMFGPSIYPDMPAEVLASQSRPGNGWEKSPPEEQCRRSIYIHEKRSLLVPLLEAFDLGESDRSNPVRFSTIPPTQSLQMLNGNFVNAQASALAERAKREAGDDPKQQVRLVLNLVTDRPPQDAEIDRGVRLIERLRSRDGATAEMSLRLFCLMALNMNEFIYLD
ncbi:MAG TPA: PSD1 and planctomycete cytochrome C domain-containing protein [Pirellulales bacterium]|nr:PSD1 and planctomycete cytochrome C domain-containing protein [Pirellulales bacterium]